MKSGEDWDNIATREGVIHSKWRVHACPWENFSSCLGMTRPDYEDNSRFASYKRPV